MGIPICNSISAWLWCQPTSSVVSARFLPGWTFHAGWSTVHFWTKSVPKWCAIRNTNTAWFHVVTVRLTSENELLSSIPKLPALSALPAMRYGDPEGISTAFSSLRRAMRRSWNLQHVPLRSAPQTNLNWLPTPLSDYNEVPINPRRTNNKPRVMNSQQLAWRFGNS